MAGLREGGGSGTKPKRCQGGREGGRGLYQRDVGGGGGVVVGGRGGGEEGALIPRGGGRRGGTIHEVTGSGVGGGRRQAQTSELDKALRQNNAANRFDDFGNRKRLIMATSIRARNRVCKHIVQHKQSTQM